MQNTKQFEDLIDKEKYQVFLFSSACSLPISFASHNWFVVNKKGIISRWEVVHLVTDRSEKNWGYVSLNFLPPFSGINIIPFYFGFYFKAKLLGSLEGDENSIAKQMADFIENSPNTYKNINTYSYFGPNSNTYMQWVLNKFPAFKANLPWNAFGQRYKN